MKPLVLSLAIAAILFVRASSGAVFIIPDGDVDALKNAINVSNTNAEDDTIELAKNGTYTLVAVDDEENGLPRILGDDYHALTIRGNGATIQRASGNEVRLFRILYLDYSTRVSLFELTVANGGLPLDAESFGGAIYNSDGVLRLNDCVIANNQAKHGGGIYSTFGTVMGTDSNFSSNIAGGYGSSGGAIDSRAADLTIVGCTFHNNSAGLGGAINNTHYYAALTDCDFIENSGVGGAVANGVGGTMSIVNSRFDRNTSMSDGGAVANNVASDEYDSVLTLRNCNLTNNSASGDGGAVYNYSYRNGITDPVAHAVVNAFDTTFANNSANLGGAIYSAECCGYVHGLAGLTVTNSTFNDNSALDGAGIFVTPSTFLPTVISNSSFFRNATYNNGLVDPDVDGGGAIYCRSFATTNSTLTVANCSLSENSAPIHGGGIFVFGTNAYPTLSVRNTILNNGTSGENLYNSNGTISSSGYNLSSDDGGGFLNFTGDQINTDPMLDPAGLQDNGGPTQTIALLSQSPAIDSGDPNAPMRDQRYFLRSGAADKGAFEYRRDSFPALNHLAQDPRSSRYVRCRSSAHRYSRNRVSNRWREWRSSNRLELRIIRHGQFCKRNQRHRKCDRCHTDRFRDDNKSDWRSERAGNRGEISGSA